MNPNVTVAPPWQNAPELAPLDSPIVILKHREQLGANVRKIISWINIGWTGWALAGGIYFLLAGRNISERTVWDAFGTNTVVGVALLFCGIVSLAAMCVKRLNKIASMLCAVWCLATAVVLQFDTPEFDQGDIDAWLLLICAFTCVMRWTLVALEPYIDK